jgi:hypothetical protein
MENARQRVEEFYKGLHDRIEIGDDAAGRTILGWEDLCEGRFSMIVTGPEPERTRAHFAGRVWPACRQRPPDYPTNIPFVPGCRTVDLVDNQSGNHVTKWESVPDMEGLRALVRTKLTEDGWSHTPPGAAGRPDVFQREAETRVLLCGRRDASASLIHERVGRQGPE